MKTPFRLLIAGLVLLASCTPLRTFAAAQTPPPPPPGAHPYPPPHWPSPPPPPPHPPFAPPPLQTPPPAPTMRQAPMTLPDVDRFVIAPPPAPATEPPAAHAPSASAEPPPATTPAMSSAASSSAANAAVPPTVRPGTALPTWVLLALLLVVVIGGLLWRRSRRLAEETARLARQHRALQSIHHRLRNESEQLRQQATNDPLTGALNRQAFAGGLREMLEHLSHYAKPVHLIVLDLDHFKAINDRLGHLAGDRALKLVTGVAHEHLDSADLLGRFGGDEFLIASTDHDATSARELAEAIRRAVEKEAARQTPPLQGLTLSMGLAEADAGTGYSADALFARADAALYEAKRQGRNRVVVASPEAPERQNAFAERHL